MPAVPQPSFTWQGPPSGPTSQFLAKAALRPPVLDQFLPDGEALPRPGVIIRPVEELLAEAPMEAPAAFPDVAFPDEAFPAADEIPAPELPVFVGGEAPDDVDAEKVIGIGNIRPIAFLEQGTRLARAVARITVNEIEYGTGFLIADDLLITNSHVLPTREVARVARVEFDYQDKFGGGERRSRIVATAPDADGFHTSPYLKNVVDAEHLDYTVVRLATKVGAKYGTIPLSSSREIEVADPGEPFPAFDVFIIQHPDGDKKKIAVADNELVWASQLTCQYLTDTLPGSSGAPVFDSTWRLVALHHAGGFIHQPGDPQGHLRNEGIVIAAILADLPDWARS